MRDKKTLAEYQALIANATVIEQDGFGIKVMQLPEQRILKLFRRKRLISSQMWTSYAFRFSRNARILKQRGIPTVSIISTHLIPEIERQAVLYKLLEGKTLRDWLAAHTPPENDLKLEMLGAFVAQLHQQGILFRSLHLANVLVMENGELGLIDIADLGFRWFGVLTVKQRIRNFHHMDRYQVDREYLSGSGRKTFLEEYLKHASLTASKNQIMASAFEDIFKK
jgi:tRNA A-37 threonylcarbamoyl transferase component Bud32